MKKKVLINIDNVDKFYRKLFLYRSFLYSFVNFESSCKSLKPLVNALNIKTRKKRIAYVYDEACRTIDNYYKNKNLCDFKDGRCISHRENNKTLKNGCCRLCEHRTGGSCPSRNIACKLFFCTTVKEKNETLKFSDISILKVLTPLQRFTLKSDYFSLEKDVINDLYSGIFAPVRVVYRFTKYKIKSLFK